MPFCDDCARFYNPSTLTEVGDCPEGHHVADATETEDLKAPWHFKVLVFFIVIYLTWRLIQLIGWIL